MKKYKGLIILFVLLSIYGAIMYILFNNNSTTDIIEKTKEELESNKDEERYFLVLDNAMLEYVDKNFKNVSNYAIEKLDKLHVYIDNKYYGDYKMQYVKVWNLFNDKNEFVSFSGNLLAYSPNFNISIRNISKRELNNDDKVDLINKFNITTFNNLTNNSVVDIDLDNNGEMDKIICLSSMEESNSDNNYYNFVAIKLNGNYKTIVNERGKNTSRVYYIDNVININNSNYDTIVLSKLVNYISEEERMSNLIINYKNGSYQVD